MIAWLALASRRRRGGVLAGAACALGCLSLAAPGAQAAQIAVDSEADTVAADNHCSLREAITSANNDAPPFMVAGECAAGAVSDVVTLPTGHFVLSQTGPPDDTNANGDLDVLGAGLTIRGQGPGSTTIDANRIDRVLDVLGGRIATLEGVTVTGGQAPKGANGGNVTGAAGMTGTGGAGGPGEPGGGIRNAGTLTITDSTIFDNRAGDGGDGGTGHGGDGTTAAIGTNGGSGSGGFAPFFSGGHGGGIFTSGALTLTRVTVTGNMAGKGGRGGTGTGGQGGGGISGNGGHGGSGNGGSGGRAPATGATLTIDLSAISGNAAGDGGANGLGQGGAGGVTSGNGSTGGNGGFGNGGNVGAALGGFGGGIYSPDPIKLTRSLVSGNRTGAGGDGGNGTGGLAGHAIPTGSNSATGGNGGFAQGGDGGGAGFGGGVSAPGEFVNVTIQGNHLGDGGDGGTGKGGNGGVSTGGPTGGSGGGGSPGDGGSGGVVGGLLAEGGSSTIRHATITANLVGAGGAVGGAIGGNGGSPGGGAGSTGTGIAGFSGGVGGLFAGSSLLANSVVAGNANDDCSPGSVDGGHNFTYPAASCPGTVADPQLAPLADNGGPTMTQALLPGSPLIDAAPAGPDCAGTDQRGVVRPQGPACDSGAYEVAVPTPPGDGGTGTGPTGSPGDAVAPVLLAASINPATFAVNLRGAREKPVTARVHRGTTFRFRLSEAAGVVFAIQRKRPGRRVNRRCVKPTRSNRLRPKCTRFVLVGRFAVVARAGDNVKKFSGRIGRRALKPGRYRATLIATDAAANKSAPKRLNFRVVRP